MKKIIFLLLIVWIAVFSSCENQKESGPSTKTLPILGPKDFIEGLDEDTLYHTIPYWSFTNQNGEIVSKTDYEGKVYVAYFFFTHCPSICPMMTKEMKRLQDATEDLDINIIAHTVDPERDSIERLKTYANDYQIDLSNYNFVTGTKESIYGLGVKGYLVPNQEDALAPGGFLHSEFFLLIDEKSRLRGYYDGTVGEEVNQLIEDIKVLIDAK